MTVTDDCAAAPCSEACAVIAARYEATLAAATYTVSFGPTTERTFRLFVMAPHAH